jgi:hypothetical protein
MTEFPTLVYRSPGPHHGPGSTTYDYRGVTNEDELSVRQAEGWTLSLDEAIKGKPAAPEPVDNAPPTRAEMEQKARELKIKFDGRTTDRKLLGLIESALRSS